MPDTDPIRWLGQELSLQLAKALEGMAGQSYPVNFDASARLDPSPAELLWWETPLSFPSGAAVSIGAAKHVWRAIGQTLLEAIGLDTDEASLRSTYTETLAQAVAALATAVGSRLGSEVTCGAGRETENPHPGGPRIRVDVAITDAGASPLVVVFSKELVAALSPKPVSMQPPSTGTMDLLLDVELPVSVSFGRTELPLKDVVKLTTGSIVELNRSISEPVEIIVNNCVIARGEVVVIEGNYGVRIDQIISRQERLRTLK